MNNVGSTTLLHPVFNNLEQVIIFRRVCIDYRSAGSIGIRIVLYLKRTFNEDLAECVNLWSIRSICIFNNLMFFYNNMRHNITSSDHKYFTNK